MKHILSSAILFFSDIGVSDVIDIIIVSLFIFALVRYASSNRVESLGKGILILVVVYFISNKIQLYTFSWILRQILNVGVIALIVIFQPEIRRALQYIGGSYRFGRGSILSQATQDDFIKSVINSLDNLSSKKVGALLVFERETALEEIANAKDSVLIDACFSEKLIGTIFYYGTPLHDGAVIIRGNRILAAKCTLPLSKNAVQTRDLGTRHKAGLGIAEASDAFVVIVSDESGMISTAVNGELKRWKKSNEIEAMLKKYCINYQKENKWNSFLDKFTGLWRSKDGRK